MGETYIRRFDSFTEWVDAAEKCADPKGESHSGSDGGWAGGSWKDAVKLAREGWHDARPRVDAVLEPVRERLAEILDLVFVREFDMFGSEPDIDRFVAGELECMYEDFAIEAPTKGKAMTVIVDAIVTGNVPVEEVFKRGAAVCALVETMTLLGFELEIWTDMSVLGNNNSKWTGLCRVHRAGDNIDMDQVVYAIGHPSNLRRLCFGVMEGETVAIRKQFGFGPPHGWGYGRPCGISDSADMIDASFTISWGAQSAQQAIKDPVQWVLDQLETQGLYSRADHEHGIQ